MGWGSDGVRRGMTGFTVLSPHHTTILRRIPEKLACIRDVPRRTLPAGDAVEDAEGEVGFEGEADELGEIAGGDGAAHRAGRAVLRQPVGAGEAADAQANDGDA